MKRVLSLFIVLVMLTALSACGGAEQKTSTPTQTGGEAHSTDQAKSTASKTDDAGTTSSGNETTAAPEDGEYEVCGVKFRLDAENEQSKLTFKYPESFEFSHTWSAGDALSYRLDKNEKAVFSISVKLFDDPDPGASGGYVNVKDAVDSISKDGNTLDFASEEYEENGIKWTHLSYKIHYGTDGSDRPHSDFCFDGGEGLYAVCFSYVSEEDVNAGFERAFLSFVRYGGVFPEPGPDLPVIEGSKGLDIRVYDENCEVRDIGSFDGAELVIPSHVNGVPVTRIDEDAISNDTMISLFIPYTVRSIGEDAASESRNLETVAFSEGLISIGEGAFGSCPKLTLVTLPASLEWVGQSAFINCAALTEVILKGGAEIAKYAFSQCPELKKITYTDGGRAYSIGSSAFEYDAALEEATFAEGLETIGSYCFSGCTSLHTLYLPASLAKIDVGAFSGVGSLHILYAGSEEEWNGITVNGGNDALKTAEITFGYGK